MTLEQVVAIICGVGSLICTIFMGLLAFFMKRTLSSLEESDKKNAADIKAVAKDLADLKSDMPLVYVLREDFIRSMNSMEAKLDQAITLLVAGKGG